MSAILNSANQFFEACETAKGWEGCKTFCHPDAIFSSQTTALAEITTLEAYCEWMKNLFLQFQMGITSLSLLLLMQKEIWYLLMQFSMVHKQVWEGRYHRPLNAAAKLRH